MTFKGYIRLLKRDCIFSWEKCLFVVKPQFPTQVASFVNVLFKISNSPYWISHNMFQIPHNMFLKDGQSFKNILCGIWNILNFLKHSFFLIFVKFIKTFKLGKFSQICGVWYFLCLKSWSDFNSTYTDFYPITYRGGF